MNAWETQIGYDVMKTFFRMENSFDDIAKVMKENKNITVVVMENDDGKQELVSLDSKEAMNRIKMLQEDGFKYKDSFPSPAK